VEIGSLTIETGSSAISSIARGQYRPSPISLLLSLKNPAPTSWGNIAGNVSAFTWHDVHGAISATVSVLRHPLVLDVPVVF
jgi:hypothetical protein